MLQIIVFILLLLLLNKMFNIKDVAAGKADRKTKFKYWGYILFTILRILLRR